jgi:hypothetical protein
MTHTNLMTARIFTGLFLTVLWASKGHSFVIPATTTSSSSFTTSSRSSTTSFFTTLYLNRDDLKDETRQERVDRMKLVRQIQQAFYQDDEMDNHLVETHTDDDWLHNVPMFRVQWTELPGFQNMLNIHVPHYTHMFRRIIKGPKPWRFGHLYLPDGSENLNNPTYKLDPGNPRAATIGTLMQISDVIEDEDGRFGMIVQAIDRFEVVEATQHVPYAMATVKLLPEEELTNLNAPPYPQELEQWSSWEVRPTLWTDLDDDGFLNISPLVNYDSANFPDELSSTTSTSTSTTTAGSTTANSLIMELEYKVWVALDDMLRLLGTVSGWQVPVPSQLLGLLPTTLPPGISKWPDDFRLEAIAEQLQTKNGDIGTYTKSPFVRVSQCSTYPSIRRARRLSFVVWVLLDSMLGCLTTMEGMTAPTKQDLLELPSIAERLSAAYQQLDSINTSLRKAMR